MRAHSVLELIGGTPVVRLQRIPSEGGAEVWAKLESFNPGGSLKDRIALAMIEDAETRGVLDLKLAILAILQTSVISSLQSQPFPFSHNLPHSPRG